MPKIDESADWLTRTALCAEAREGRLYLFMPPLEQLEDYLELVAAIEATAEELHCPVLLEGYEPPSRSASDQFPGYAGSRCDRGQCASVRHAGTSWSNAPSFSMKRRDRPA